jgi:hypothetical protein
VPGSTDRSATEVAAVRRVSRGQGLGGISGRVEASAEMIADFRGMVRKVSTAALSVKRLAMAAIPGRCTSWARKGPTTAPTSVAAALPVTNAALTRPSTALGITRCMAVCGTTSDIVPNMPMAIAAGSALASDDEVNSRKYAMAVAIRLTARRFLS